MVSEKDLRERIARLKAQKGLKELKLRGKRGTEKLQKEFKQLKQETSRFKGVKQFAKTLGIGTLEGIKVIAKEPKPLRTRGKKKKEKVIRVKIEKARQPIKKQVKFEPIPPEQRIRQQVLTRQQRRNQADRDTINLLMSL